MSGLRLPSPDYMGGVMPVRLTTRFTPTIGTATSNGFAFVCNPYLLATSQFSYGTEGAGVVTNLSIPIGFTTSATSTTAIPDGTAGQATTVIFQGAVATSVSNPANLICRVTGVQYKIDYIGSNQNKGAVLYAIVNPDERSLICRTVGSANPWTSGFATPAALATLNQNVSVHRLGDSFRFCWRPADLSFKKLSTYVDLPATALAGLTLEPPELSQYLPLSTNQTTPASVSGWCSGFVCVPAVSTAATAANYIVTVDVELELSLAYSDGASAGVAPFPASRPCVSHPAAHAVAANALAATHQMRREHTPHISASSLAHEAYTGAKSMATSAAKEAAVEGLTRAFQSVF